MNFKVLLKCDGHLVFYIQFNPPPQKKKKKQQQQHQQQQETIYKQINADSVLSLLI